jgi:hypothetical protein
MFEGIILRDRNNGRILDGLMIGVGWLMRKLDSVLRFFLLAFLSRVG